MEDNIVWESTMAEVVYVTGATAGGYELSKLYANRDIT